MDEAASSTCQMESDSEGLGCGPRDPAFVCPGLHDVRAAEGQHDLCLESSGSKEYHGLQCEYQIPLVVRIISEEAA
ncbi:hypothetical protein JEQ12_013414 [Ovis aries]|uniref:Uncharacterized protein n=1 Tax=Ovis aries TaxID=9940 RepID=A0A836A8N7_SHEEP|nr:hypothetical protein JEQ12_013414 [Ovis aries]